MKMISGVIKRLRRLGRQRAGQHMSEFVLLFLALCMAFVGMRLYLRRGVNAKLRLMQDQLNEVVTEVDHEVMYEGPPMPVHVEVNQSSGSGYLLCKHNKVVPSAVFYCMDKGLYWCNCMHDLAHHPDSCTSTAPPGMDNWPSGYYIVTVTAEGGAWKRTYDGVGSGRLECSSSCHKYLTNDDCRN